MYSDKCSILFSHYSLSQTVIWRHYSENCFFFKVIKKKSFFFFAVKTAITLKFSIPTSTSESILRNNFSSRNQILKHSVNKFANYTDPNFEASNVKFIFQS